MSEVGGPRPKPAPLVPERRIGPYEQSLRESRARAEEMARERAARRRRTRLLGGLVGVVVAVAVGFGAWTLLGRGSADPTASGGPSVPRSCDAPTPVRLAVPSSIAPGITAVTESLNARDDGPCALFAIEGTDGFTVAGSVAGPSHPDAWITDSPEWVARANTTAGRTLTAGPVFASSGVVVALPRAAGASVGAQPTWSSVLGGETAVRVPDPQRSTAGALSLGAAAAGGLSDQQVSDVVARGAKVSGTTVDLDAVATSDPPTGAVVTEAEVSAFNEARPDRALATVAPTDGTGAVQYSLVTLSNDAKLTPLISALGAYLQTEDARKVLSDNGFRTPGGLDPSLPTPMYGSARIGEAPAADAVAKVRQAWSAAAPRTQALLALDVSGSLLEKTSDGTRLSAMQEAASQGVASLPPQTSVALWLYSLHIGDKGDDHKPVVSYGTTGDAKHLAAIDAALVKLTKSVGGGRGLYDSIRASFAKAKTSWVGGHTNTVVVVTDGPNEDDYGRSLAQLKQELAAAKDPARPVRIVIIGFGPDPDAKAMAEIASLTGGEYIAAPEPADLRPALTRALGG